MEHISRRHLLSVPAACLAFGVPAAAQAQAAYPTKPVHVIFPYPPGSPLDAIGRLIADRAAQLLGQPFVFDNVAGANGIVGTTRAARAAPDGYTIHLTTTSAFVLNSFLRKDLPYDPLQSFTPITEVDENPVALIVSAKLPVTNFKEFIQYLKQNPGKLNYASIGVGSYSHLMFEQLKAVAGVDLVHVPYQGVGTMPLEIVSGRIDATIIGVGSLFDQLGSGQVKALAFISSTRNQWRPEVPAITEELPTYHPFYLWMGFVAPARTPDPIVKKLSETITTVLAQPDVRKAIEQQEWFVKGGTPEEFRKTLQADMPTVEAAFKSAGVKPE